MARPPKHDEGRILDAAAALVAAGGPGAATMAAIGHAVGVPNGSLYHRFRNRDELLGRLWLGKAAVFQDRWAASLEIDDPRDAGLAAALSIGRVAREDFEGARIMLLHRREDFLAAGWPRPMAAEAERLGRQVARAVDDLSRRLFGTCNSRTRQVTIFATIDVPFGAVRRHVAAGKRPPPSLDPLIATAYAAVIDAARAS